MRGRPWLTAFGIAIAMAASAAAASDGTTMTMTTSKHVLDDGMTVLVTPMPGSRLVSLYALVKTGSALEGRFLGSGLSHFMEHMLFKGTERRGVGEISRAIQAMGGTINASTGFDATVYTVTVPREAFEPALDILADMLQHARFDPQEILKEREVVFSEMRMRRERPDEYLNQRLFRTVFREHPYGIPVIGYEDLLRRVERKDFVDYYRRRYVPNNIVFSVAGGITEAEVLPAVREAFADFPRGISLVRNLMPEPEQVSPRRYEESFPTDLARLALAFPGVRVSDEDMYALDLLAMILGQGRSSRLYRDLVEERRLVYSVSAWDYTPVDKGMFAVNALLEEKNLDAALEAVLGQIEDIRERGVTSEELEKVRRQAVAAHVRSLQRTGDVAYQAAADEASLGDCNFSRYYVSRIEAVRRQDIRRVAREYLRPERRSVVVLRPRHEASSGLPRATPASTPAIEKVVLDNGMTILLRPDPSYPTVEMVLALRGGTSQETVETNGLSALTARVWTKATRRYPSERLAVEVERRGASLNGFSGRNSLGIRIGLLAGDEDFGLELLREFVLRPVFSSEDVIKEKTRMLSALRARRDDVATTAMDALREDLFPDHPFRFLTLGTPESLKRLERKDVANFVRRMAVPANMVLSVFGDFDADRVRRAVEEAFGGLEGPAPVLRTRRPSPLPAPRDERIERDQRQAVVAVGFQGPDLFSEDYYAAQVLAAVLGSPFSGRIFDRIREEGGHSYALGGDLVAGVDAGMLYFYVLTSPEEAPRVKATLLGLIGEAAVEGVSPDELSGIKTYLKGRFRRQIETNADLAFVCALDERYGLGYDHYRRYSEAVDRVGEEEVKRAAQKYLDTARAVVIITTPKSVGGEEEGAAGSGGGGGAPGR